MTKSRKHCVKRRNCSFWAISSFVTMFSKSRLLQRRQKASIWGKGLNIIILQSSSSKCSRLFSFYDILRVALYHCKENMFNIVGVGLWHSFENMILSNISLSSRMGTMHCCRQLRHYKVFVWVKGLLFVYSENCEYEVWF